MSDVTNVPVGHPTGWDNRWLELCNLISTWSKDRSTKFGCVIVNSRQSVLSLGWNGFPRDINDKIESRHERPTKYLWTEHAERNAIYNAASTGNILLGSTLYVNGIPCADCARAIIQSGIVKVIMIDKFIPTYLESQNTALQMLAEAYVETHILKGSEFGTTNSL
jgi:dCMP deaminase